MARGRIELLARARIRLHDQVLLCRSIGHGHSYLPGGHVEFGESATDALERELMEECGLTVVAGPLVGIFELRFEQGSKERHELTLVFHVELPGAPNLSQPPPVRSREGKIAFEWCALARLDAAGLLPKQMVEWLRTGGPLTPIAWRSDDERGSPRSGEG